MKSVWTAQCNCRDDLGQRRADRVLGRLRNGDELVLKLTCSICYEPWTHEFVSDDDAEKPVTE